METAKWIPGGAVGGRLEPELVDAGREGSGQCETAGCDRRRGFTRRERRVDLLGCGLAGDDALAAEEPHGGRP